MTLEHCTCRVCKQTLIQQIVAPLMLIMSLSSGEGLPCSHIMAVAESEKIFLPFIKSLPSGLNG